MRDNDQLDGCAIDFTEHAIDDDEVESMLIPEGDEQDEVDEDGDPLSPASPDKGLASRLRRVAFLLGDDDGPLFKVREVDGWKSRDNGGVTFNGRGSVNHHTAAGSAPPNAPSLGICTHGRGQPNPLPGPLCNVLQAYNDTAIVIAAGSANHAGTGGWKGLEGNSSVYGLEVEHPGTSRVKPKRVEVMAAIHVAFLWRPNGRDLEPRMVCQHREWSTVGKPDFATNFSRDDQADEFRDLVRQTLAKVNTEHRRRKRRRRINAT